MTDKSNFTPEEWKLLLESVMVAGIAVTAAEPSGRWGLLKESFAGGTALSSEGPRTSVTFRRRRQRAWTYRECESEWGEGLARSAQQRCARDRR